MTNIHGPYANYPRDKTRKLQGAIPESLYNKVFHSRFPLHGAQDRILTSLFAWFLTQLEHLEVPETFSLENETIANHILNELAKHRIAGPERTPGPDQPQP